MIRRLVNAWAAFVATAIVAPLVALAAPFAAAWWAWTHYGED